ncbi:MAG TPA: M28 family peptidase [Candidatus Dormibacteraeota bacterium]|nr:M28 family peptidase [Candidatus Dormibacteraeota bacterium]
MHVHFLAQPALRGRKAQTRGSRFARRYIEKQFRDCHLVSWPTWIMGTNSSGFELPFGYGKNVVGVLPGSDPALSREVVLVSAHYDHLGKDKHGIHPGAADNASGVAALLEIARECSSTSDRPKRSLAFAAFDCEEKMLLGSFAFTCRDDFKKAKLAAVLNMDMLGRDLLDVITNTLFVSGVEHYPELRDRAREFGTENGIRVLPLGSDLVGPRSDQVAFQSLPAPCLFFSCGTFRDYHQPADTADNVDYAALDRSTRVIARAVNMLANEPSPGTRTAADTTDPEELRSVVTVMKEVLREPGKAGLKKDDTKSVENLMTGAETLLKSNAYTTTTREKLILEATGTLVPYFMPMEFRTSRASGEGNALVLQYLQEMYLRYGHELMEGYRQLVAQLVKYQPGVIRQMPKFDYDFYSLADRDISFIIKPQSTGNENGSHVPAGETHYALHALANSWTMKAEVKRTKWVINSFSMYMGGSVDQFDCEGTRDDIADYCALRLRMEHTNQAHIAQFRKVLAACVPESASNSAAAFILERKQHYRLNTETEWIGGCLQSECTDLALLAVQVVEDDLENQRRHHRAHALDRAPLLESLRTLMGDCQKRADLRAAAIRAATKSRDRVCLRKVATLLNDSTPAYRLEDTTLLKKDYPFADQAMVKVLKDLYTRGWKSSSESSWTLGEVAMHALKAASGKDFGNDQQKWDAWIDKSKTL